MGDTIQYHRSKTGEVTVYLGRRLIGHIKPVGDGWAYFPRGKTFHGPVMPSIAQVKKILESV